MDPLGHRGSSIPSVLGDIYFRSEGMRTNGERWLSSHGISDSAPECDNMPDESIEVDRLRYLLSKHGAPSVQVVASARGLS